MRVSLSLHRNVKWSHDLFSELCKVAPHLFTDKKATVYIRGQYLGLDAPVDVFASLQNQAIVYRFELPSRVATPDHVANLKSALEEAGKKLRLDYTTVKDVLSGNNGVAFALDASKQQAVIIHRDEL